LLVGAIPTHACSVDPARKLATYEDLLSLPPDARAEIVNGTITLLPAPRPRHLKVRGALRRFVGGPYDDDDGFGGPGGWWIFGEVDVRFHRHETVRADLAGWRRARLPDPDQRPIDVVPDWICEVLSASNVARDRVEKRALYAAAGVAHYWIVDPDARTLEALMLRDGRWLESGAWTDGAVVRIPPFEEVELDISRLFLPRAPTPPESP
jgi:Uma2 family endonuclease